MPGARGDGAKRGRLFGCCLVIGGGGGVEVEWDVSESVESALCSTNMPICRWHTLHLVRFTIVDNIMISSDHGDYLSCSFLSLRNLADPPLIN